MCRCDHDMDMYYNGLDLRVQSRTKASSCMHELACASIPKRLVMIIMLWVIDGECSRLGVLLLVKRGYAVSLATKQ
jgi:hypothetical protein